MKSKNPDINYPIEDIKKWIEENSQNNIINKTKLRKDFKAQQTNSYLSLSEQLGRIVDIVNEEKKLIEFTWREKILPRDTSNYTSNNNTSGTYSETRLFEYICLYKLNERVKTFRLDTNEMEKYDSKDRYNLINNPVVNISDNHMKNNFVSKAEWSRQLFNTKNNGTDHKKTKNMERAFLQLEKKGYIKIERKYVCIFSKVIKEGHITYEHDCSKYPDLEVTLQDYEQFKDIRREVFKELKEQGEFCHDYRDWYTLVKNGEYEDLELFYDELVEAYMKYIEPIENKEGKFAVRSIVEVMRITLLRHIDINLDIEEVMQFANKLLLIGVTKKNLILQSKDLYKQQLPYEKDFEKDKDSGIWEEKKRLTKEEIKEIREQLIQENLYDKYNLPNLDKALEELDELLELKPRVLKIKLKK